MTVKLSCVGGCMYSARRNTNRLRRCVTVFSSSRATHSSKAVTLQPCGVGCADCASSGVATGLCTARRSRSRMGASVWVRGFPRSYLANRAMPPKSTIKSWFVTRQYNYATKRSVVYNVMVGRNKLLPRAAAGHSAAAGRQ